MEIKRYQSSLVSSNMYLITEGKHAIVIDPFEHTEVAEGFEVDKILLTHEHYDHISGVNLWKSVTGAPVLCSKKCAENIQSSRKNFAYYFKDFCELQTWVELEKVPEHDREYFCIADDCFYDTTSFDWMGHQIELFEIPGHSLGSIMILLDEKNVFTGDSLMENVEIELRMPGGSKRKWQEIGKPRVEQLPNGIHVFPGHFDDYIYAKGE